jgi:hypothetical protein
MGTAFVLQTLGVVRVFCTGSHAIEILYLAVQDRKAGNSTRRGNPCIRYPGGGTLCGYSRERS